MTELNDVQKKILSSLAEAIINSNLQGVQDIFNNKENKNDDIQAVLSHEGVMGSHKDTILDYAIMCFRDKVRDTEKFGESVEIIGLIWQEANQKTRDSVCDRVIDSFSGYLGEIYPNNAGICFDLKEVIQEVEEHKRVRDFNSKLKLAITNLDVDQVKKALVDCGENIEKVLMRKVSWSNGSRDVLLAYPLKVKYSKELNQEDVEKIKEIFKLMFAAASPQLLGFEPNENNYVMNKLTGAQKRFAKIPGVGEQYFQDLIQEFEENLSKDTLDNARTDDQIAWDKAYATQFSQEINQDPSENDDLNFIDDTDLGQDTVNSAPTTGNKTPEKNDTTFWSEHKGKIALGVTGLCVAGAVAAYVLAYPAVALALAVLAAVILIGAGIDKACKKSESPSTKNSDPVVSECCNNAKTV